MFKTRSIKFQPFIPSIEYMDPCEYADNWTPDYGMSITHLFQWMHWKLYMKYMDDFIVHFQPTRNFFGIHWILDNCWQSKSGSSRRDNPYTRIEAPGISRPRLLTSTQHFTTLYSLFQAKNWKSEKRWQSHPALGNDGQPSLATAVAQMGKKVCSKRRFRTEYNCERYLLG